MTTMKPTAQNLLHSSNIKILSTRSEYNLWSIRMNAHLINLSLWDAKRMGPLDDPQTSSILISSLSDDLLTQVSFLGDLEASTIWNYLKKTFLSSDLTTRSSAFTALASWNYDAASMIDNKTLLL